MESEVNCRNAKGNQGHKHSAESMAAGGKTGDFAKPMQEQEEMRSPRGCSDVRRVGIASTLVIENAA
jgi:hypothetical protein